MTRTRQYHWYQVVFNEFIDEFVIVLNALPVDVVWQSVGHNARPGDGKAVELHLEKCVRNGITKEMRTS
jgi:hypothetical protein